MRMAADPGRALSTAELAELAEEFGLSRNLLAKILQRLAQAGIVTTRCGRGGGAVLALPPETIRLGALVRLLEQKQSLVECFALGGGKYTIIGCGRLKARLRSAEAAFLTDLNGSTLADIALPRSRATAA